MSGKPDGFSLLGPTNPEAPFLEHPGETFSIMD